MDIKELFREENEDNFFIRTQAKTSLNSSQKAALNRKGNLLFNSGDIENARRIYLTTGYSDGIIRVGDHYKSMGYMIDALRMYWIAPDHHKAEPIIVQLAEIIKSLIEEENDYE